jgi:hypothetical protein
MYLPSGLRGLAGLDKIAQALEAGLQKFLSS